MRRISSHNAKQNFGAVLAMVEKEPVEIVKYRNRKAVIMSTRDYDALEALKISEARRQIAEALAHIAAPKTRPWTPCCVNCRRRFEL